MEHRQPSLIGPLILITLGVLFLLANFGLMPFSIWEIALRFWPLTLILIGLEIIFGRRSALGALVVMGLWFAVVGGLVWFASTQGGAFSSRAAAITEPLNEPLGDIQSASIELHNGIASTFVTALGSDTSNLMQGTFGHPPGTRIIKNYNASGGKGRLALREENAAWMPFAFGESRWDIALNSGIPLTLNIQGGIGRVNLDLSRLNVTALNVDTGVGNIEVIAPQTGNMTVRINGGVGNARVTLPEGVAARVRVNKGLGALRVNEARFPKSGNVYQSADWANASNQIEIEIDGGVGSVEVR